MVTHPETAERAHEEIDRVIGNERLPDFNDRNSMPYVNCILKEIYRSVLNHLFRAQYLILLQLESSVTLRYRRFSMVVMSDVHPILRVGIPHGALDDDVYRGMRIPRSATVIANIWYAVLRISKRSALIHCLIN